MLVSAAVFFSFGTPSFGAEQEGFALKDEHAEYLAVFNGDKLVARYMYGHDTSTPAKREATYKPYLHVFDPEGQMPITKGAGGAFPHHRGIFIGWNKMAVNGKKYDRWHMIGGDQVHERFVAQNATRDRASFTSLVKWTGDTPEAPIIEEERTFTFLPPAAPAYALIDTVSKIKAVAGETVLDGDPEHAGLHFRPADNVDRKQTTYFYPRANADPHKDRDYPWFGETFALNGKHYTVVYLSHPSNPKEALASAYRDYARFGAFWRTTIPAGGTQEFRARFLVIAGEMPSAEFIQKAWNEYAGANEPTPQATAKPAEYGQSPDSKKKDAPAPSVPPPPKSAATPGAEATNTGATILGATTKKRAGGGPENPELVFKLPPPPVLSVQEALKTFKLASGFAIEAVASEPLIEAPIAMSWDDQGRAYVLEMRGFMQDMDGTGEDQPNGRVKRLEDTDGDGVFDKATVFVDRLIMPRALMALGDGALVGEPPNLTFYHDTDGDGVADAHELVNDKFGAKGGQPEHMANSPTWMMDNWIWSNGHGFRYRYSHGKFLTEPTTGFGQWGRTQDDCGRQFFNYNSDLLRSDVVPLTYYGRNDHLLERVAINYQVMRDQTTWPCGPTPGVNRGYGSSLRADGTLKAVTATCGPAIYRGDLFPQEFKGNAFVPEPSANLVKRLILSDNEGVLSAKSASEGSEFLCSTDERFRPVNAYTGPDGALYIVDMARGVLQHKAFLTYYLAANIEARRLEQPINLGRIYRIAPTGLKPTITKLPRDTAAIVPLLAHPNGWVRDTAQRVLVERGDATALEPLKKLARDGATREARLHALWTLEGLNALTPELIRARLRDDDVKVRAAAVRLADKTLIPDLLDLADDGSAELRMHVAFKLSDERDPNIERVVIGLLKKGGHPFLADAVASGLAGRELEFLQLLLDGQSDADRDQFAATGIFGTLANCVVKERRGARITALLALAAAQPANGSSQVALLTGIAGKPPGRAAPRPNPIKLESAPAALAVLQNHAGASTKPLLTRIATQLTWPGKPGARESTSLPLTAEQQRAFENGKALYAAICGACHQPTGAGLAGLAPPLLNSEWALGPVDRPIRIVLQGLTGKIEVGATTWQLEMPGLGALSDQDVAAVLTYVRREWEHSAPAVSSADVTRVRSLAGERTNAWTAEELRRPLKLEQARAR